MCPRIEQLKTELEQLEEAAQHCHPGVKQDLRSLIEDMRAHVAELETVQSKIDDETDDAA
jgi:hypothetical protein